MSNRNGVWSLPAQYQAIADQDWTMAPGAPTGVSATAGSTQAEVSFTAPTFAGIPGTITQFKVTSSSGQTATGSASPITVTGLTNGNAVTFTAQAQNAIGLGKASAASSSVTPLAEVISGLFSTFLYTGTGSDGLEINNDINLSGKGGLVWAKRRNGNDVHWLVDTERGLDKSLQSNANDAPRTGSSQILSFDSDGFTLGNRNEGQNYSGLPYVSWTFRKEPKFFDIVTYTGNGSARTISHNLGSVPGMMLIKKTSGAGNWMVYHRGANGGTNPEQYYAKLNDTDAFSTLASAWNNTAPTSSVFSLGDQINVNENGSTYVAYLFAHNNNDGGFGPDSEDIIKCGYYTGNNSTTGPIVNLGFEPQWLFIKHTDSAGNSSFILDNMRGISTGSADPTLSPNAAQDEQDAQNMVELTPTGFQIKRANSNINGSGNNYIYVAIRRPDMSTPTSASDVFAVDTRNSTGDGNEPGYRSTFPVDMVVLRKDKTQSSGETHVISRLTGNKYLKTYDTSTESSDSAYVLDYMNGFNSDTSTKTDRIAWMWKREKGYFDAVAYTSNTTYPNTFSHNLGVVPEMIWIKRRDSGVSWAVYHSALGNTKHLVLNTSAAESSSSYWNNTTPTASVVTVGGQDETWGYGSYNYVAYLFATVAGVSKVGSYTGTGSTQTIDCGFSSGAKFVLIKCTNDAENWIVFDSVRGIVSGNDPYLSYNTTDAEITNQDLIDPVSSGFAVNTNFGEINNSSNTYIFYAIAA